MYIIINKEGRQGGRVCRELKEEEERIEFLVRFQNRLLPFIDTHGSTSPAAYFVLQPYFVFSSSSSSSLSLLSVFYSDASIEQITFI